MTWQYLEPDEIKDTIAQHLRNYVKPYQTLTTNTLAMYSAGDVQISQSFYPFSTKMNSISLYITKSGTPTSSLTVHLVQDSSNNPTGSTLSSVTITPTNVGSGGWITKTLSKSDLISKDKHWLKIVSTGQDVSNYYNLYYSSDDDAYFGTLVTSKIYSGGSWSNYNYDIAFKVHLDEMIYKRYPYTTITLDDYPMVVVDIFGRPRVDEKWIDSKIMEYFITVNIMIYTRYSSEMDYLTKFVDRAMFKYRTEIEPFYLVSPGRMTNVNQDNNNIFSRGIDYYGRMYIYRG